MAALLLIVIVWSCLAAAAVILATTDADADRETTLNSGRNLPGSWSHHPVSFRTTISCPSSSPNSVAHPPRHR
jgi:hypothetical protein